MNFFRFSAIASNSMKTLKFSTEILKWYYNNRRELPWRGIDDPYKIWISEVILQQTRIEQGRSYYEKFIGRFPNVASLAAAREEEVLKLWQGLGYYSRARNLHKGARQVMEQYKGVIPAQFTGLKSLHGVGEYTAAAIASIAFHQPVAAIDGNVFRVMSRFFGIDLPIDTAQGKKTFRDLAGKCLNKEKPGDYNQAVMEFGALLCVPQNPKCTSCPLSDHCFALHKNSVANFPVKSKKIKQRKRYFHYLVLQYKQALYFKKRTQNDIWKNLFDFPLIESNEALNIEQLSQTNEWSRIFRRNQIAILDISPYYKHLLTHQQLFASFIQIEVKNENYLPHNFIKIDKRNTFELPVPKIIENYLEGRGLI